MATQEEIELDVKIDTSDDAVTEQLKESRLGRRFWSSLILLVIAILFYVITTTVFRDDRIGRTTTTDYVFYVIIAILTIATIYFATFGRIRLKRRTRDIFYGGGVQLPEAIENKGVDLASAKNRSETSTSSYQDTQADVAASETERKPNNFRSMFGLVRSKDDIERVDRVGVVLSQIPPDPTPDIERVDGFGVVPSQLPPDPTPDTKKTRRKSTPPKLQTTKNVTIPESVRGGWSYVPGTRPVNDSNIVGDNMVSNRRANLFPTADGSDKNNQKQELKQNLKSKRRGSTG